MKTNFPNLIEKENNNNNLFISHSKWGGRGFEIISDHHRDEKIVSECLRRNKGFTVKPYCSMQMDLYKNNLTAAAHYVCAFKNLFKSSSSQISIFSISYNFWFLPLSWCGRMLRGWIFLDTATRNLTPRVTQKLDTFNSYLLTFSQYFNVTIKYWPARIQEWKQWGEIFCILEQHIIQTFSLEFFFQSNPCQHPIIILRDVREEDLGLLLTFMYAGEVQVDQDRLSSFLRTAETLQIKGLLDHPLQREQCQKTASVSFPIFTREMKSNSLSLCFRPHFLTTRSRGRLMTILHWPRGSGPGPCPPVCSRVATPALTPWPGIMVTETPGPGLSAPRWSTWSPAAITSMSTPTVTGTTRAAAACWARRCLRRPGPGRRRGRTPGTASAMMTAARGAPGARASTRSRVTGRCGTVSLPALRSSRRVWRLYIARRGSRHFLVSGEDTRVTLRCLKHPQWPMWVCRATQQTQQARG